MLLHDAPGKKLLGLIVAFLAKESLCDPVFDLACIRERGVGIEADEAPEIVHAGHVPVDDARLDGVFPFSV